MIATRRMFAGLALAASLFAGAAGAQAQQPAADPANTMIIQTKDGDVTVRLRPDLAPRHVAQIKALVQKGFYNGVVFHRVMEGFMAQTGDPTGTGMGGSDLPNIPAEFTQTPFVRGTLGMARSQNPNSANSQFFICFNDTGCASLRGQYTVVGQVTSGMEAIDKVKRGAPGSGTVSGPDRMISVRMGK
ncbi:MAG: peptidylprolyl isomerase [Beijerinckiaceae bacterium]|nr:peptidylprolyl isomerase [Beijerinckiaceae bacterium]